MSVKVIVGLNYLDLSAGLYKQHFCWFMINVDSTFNLGNFFRFVIFFLYVTKIMFSSYLVMISNKVNLTKVIENVSSLGSEGKPHS